MNKEKIKNHLKEHKREYIVGVGVAIITVLIMRRSNIARGGMGEGSARGAVTNTASFNFSNKPSIKVTTVIEREGRGHPGWPVRNLETKRIDLSQKAAANHFGIPEKILSGHLKGKFPDADGLHFERVNLN